MDRCSEHTGCVERIKHLEYRDSEMSEKLTKLEDRIDDKFDAFSNRLNVILGGIVVACIMLVVNIVLKS